MSKQKYGLLQGKYSKDPLVWKVSSTGNWSLRAPISYILLGILEQWPLFFFIKVFYFPMGGVCHGSAGKLSFPVWSWGLDPVF
jgi:hypothetical protein